MWWVTPAGKLAVQRLVVPAAPADLTITRRNIVAISRQPLKASQRRRVGYDRMWLVQDASGLAGSVSDSDRQRYGAQYRFATAQDSSIPYAHKLAVETDTEGLFALEADAVAEAARLLALHGTPRGLWTLTVAGVDPFDIAVGDILAIADWDRLGLDPDGSYFVVVGLEVDLKSERVGLTLWG